MSRQCKGESVGRVNQLFALTGSYLAVNGGYYGSYIGEEGIQYITCPESEMRDVKTSEDKCYQGW